VRVAQRNRPQDLPKNIPFTRCDVLDAQSVRDAVQGASQIVLAIGFHYDRKTWRANWPKAMAHVIDAAAISKARIVFVDNLYMYGPQTAPLREDMALQDYGAKPAVRAMITRQWKDAHHAGRVKFAALRAPDFYGPGVKNSHLGDLAFGNLAKGKKPMLGVDPDRPHAFAYVPDIARGVISLLDAPDEDFGQAWHIPSAPMRTPREILAMASGATGKKLGITTVPMGLLPLLGVFMPFMKEMNEMRFQWDRPYDVDASKFAKRFWADATPLEVGAVKTLKSFAET
jgi:nucleoside-diphosphate-sugar epimerase